MRSLAPSTTEGLARFVADLPSPNRAALYGAGLGAAVAIFSDRPILKYGLGFGLASWALVVLTDAAAAAGFVRGTGCDTCGGA